MVVKVNSYFCGAGLMDLGLQMAGIEINEAYELDPAACKTYSVNLGKEIKPRDVSKALVLDQSDCDGMVFTFPCTKYSAIADISETRTGDDLFLHSLRHIAVKNPEFYAVENVPGMRVFPVVMETLTKLPNYYITVFCPIKTSSWLPQRRDRLIIIATKRAFSFRPPSNSRPVLLSEILEKDPQVTRPAAIAARMNGFYRDRPIISDPARGDIAPTCLAHYAKDKSTRLVKDSRFPLGVRPYSVREWARLQGIPDDFKFPVSNTEAYKQIGNGVPVTMAHWLGGEVNRYMNHRRAA